MLQVRSKSMDSDEEVLYRTELIQLFSEEDDVRLIIPRSLYFSDFQI